VIKSEDAKLRVAKERLAPIARDIDKGIARRLVATNLAEMRRFNCGKIESGPIALPSPAGSCSAHRLVVFSIFNVAGRSGDDRAMQKLAAATSTSCCRASAAATRSRHGARVEGSR